MRMQQTASKPVRDPDVQVTVAGDGARVVHLSGAWDIRALQSRAAALQSALRDAGPAQVSLWDLTQIQRFDHIGAMLVRSEEHTSELQSRLHLVCRLLLEKKKKSIKTISLH